MNASRHLILAALLAGSVGCSEGLYHDLDEQTANELVVALHEAGIHADKVEANRRGYTVEVPRGTTVHAMNALQTRGLPRPTVEGFTATFPDDRLVPSPAEERARIQYATAQEVRRSLLSIDGIVDAHVNLVLPENRTRAPQAETRASVVLRWSGDRSPITDDDVRRVVCGGVEGLEPGAVEVLMTQAAAPAQLAPLEQITVGPLALQTGSKGATQAVLATLTSIILLLGALLVALGLRGRRPTRGVS